MTTTTADLLLSSLNLSRALATQRLIAHLDNILEVLPTARVHRADRQGLAHTVLMLDTVRTAAGRGAVGFAHALQLRDAAVYLRYTRASRDEPTTDSPLYNVTIWLAEALISAGEVARTADLIAGAERFGITG